MNRLIISHLLLCCFVIFAKAQDSTVVATEQLIADIFEQYTAESENATDYESFYEELMYCATHPININRATTKELQRLLFLSDDQIENIEAYVYLQGKLHTLYELQLIPGLDLTDIRRMIPFIYLGEATEKKRTWRWAEFWQKAKHSLLVRFDGWVEPKEGYQYLPTNEEANQAINEKKYLGAPFYNAIKYRLHYDDRILVGITGEQDAGEQFFKPKTAGYDFYAGYLQINKIGILQTLLLGDFQASFGQGLVLRNDFATGKSSSVLNVSSRNEGVKKYTSTDENNFFRGIATVLRIGKCDLTAFYSHKNIDADTAQGMFSSIQTTGLHRTTLEYKKRHTVVQQLIGTNASFTLSNAQIGLTAVQTFFNQSLIPTPAMYNYFYFAGKRQSTIGLHYKLRWININFFGELATTDISSFGHIHGCSFHPTSEVGIVALYRYYAPQYNALHATAFAEGTHTNNETGLYIGAEVRALERWKFSIYADSYRFMWPTFSIDKPSTGNDYLLQADFTPTSTVNMFWRCKYEQKQANATAIETPTATTAPITKASLRYNLSYEIGQYRFKNVLEGNITTQTNNSRTWGITAAQDIGYSFSAIPLKIDCRYQFFDATDYDNRIYSYEKDVYGFYTPMYNGRGSRYYLVMQYDIGKQLSCRFKIAQTVYADDRQTIGTDNETITGNRKTDLRCMLQWNF